MVGRPILITSWLGRAVASGTINIGETGNFERRRQGMMSGIETCSGHSAANLFRYLDQFAAIQQVYPGYKLQYSYRPAADKAQAVDWEAFEVKKYSIEFGQLPILNRQVPRPYDDDEWNSASDEVYRS